MNRFSLFLLLLSVAGCELLEEDISEVRIEVVAPADKAVAAPGPVDFRWRTVKRAAGYELTVASPSLAGATCIVVDTLLLADTLSRSYGCRAMLDAGEYEWSLRAFNGGYASEAVVRRLTVGAEPGCDEGTTDTTHRP